MINTAILTYPALPVSLLISKPACGEIHSANDHPDESGCSLGCKSNSLLLSSVRITGDPASTFHIRIILRCATPVP